MSQPVLRAEPNGVFYAHWNDGRSRRHSFRTKDASTARDRFAHWLLADMKAIPAETRTAGQCWEAYAAQHLDHVASPATLISAWAALRVTFENTIASKIGQREIDIYVNRRKRAPATLRREISTLLTLLRFNGIEPPKKLRLPARSTPRDRWLTDEEIHLMREAAIALYGANGKNVTFFEIALATGARRSAICDLTWPQVDFAAGIIHFDLPGRRSTKKRRVSVPMSKGLYLHLQTVAVDKSLRVAVAGAETSKAPVVGNFAAWHAIKRIARKAGLTGVSPHVLRHTAATHMARRGVPLFIIAKILGNSVAVVERTYAKYLVGDLRDAVEKIGA